MFSDLDECKHGINKLDCSTCIHGIKAKFGKPFLAKYASTCIVCKEPWEVMDEICMSLESGFYRHASCRT